MSYGERLFLAIASGASYGDTVGRLFTIEITCDVTTYVCAIVATDVRSGHVVFGLSSDALVGTRKRRRLMAKRPGRLQVCSLWSCGRRSPRPMMSAQRVFIIKRKEPATQPGQETCHG